MGFSKSGLAGRVVALILGLLMLGVPYAAPVLQSFIDPVHGVMGATATGGVPEGVFRVEGIEGTAKVYWDRFGVPHIYATSDEIGFYAMGWVTASQRLFQMDLMRRIPEGRLAALVGEKGLESDRFMIMAGIADSIEKSWEEMRARPELEPVVRMLEAYARGVNDYIEYAKKNNLLPVEYRVLGLEPEPWRPQDTIAIAKLIAYNLAWNDEDLVVQKIVNRHGPEAILVAKLFDFINWTGTVTQAECEHAVSWASVTGLNSTATFTPPSTIPGSVPRVDVDAILSLTQAPLQVQGLPGRLAEASNNWVVNGSYTRSGRPLVANDPHLSLIAPPIWFLAELHTPTFKVVGALFPGTPLVIIGRNPSIAWAFTNVMGDFTDYYYYKWSSDGKYLYKGQWLEPEEEERTIKVWDPVSRTYREEIVKVRKTIHGYLIEVENETLAVRWTGQDPSFEVAFFYFLDKAENVREALQAQKYFHVPVQNLIVADKYGNFAYSPFGAFPNRTNLPVYEVNGVRIVNKGFLPFNGSNGEGEWNGYLPPDQIPILYNPPVPFIATANSKVWNGTCGDFIGWHYHDRFREERIKQLLTLLIESRGRLGMRDMRSVQLDQYDLGVRHYLEILLDLAKGVDHPLMEELRDWYTRTGGGSLGKDSWQASVAMAWLFTFHRNLWEKISGGAEHIWFFREHYATSFIMAAREGDPVAVKLLGGESLEELAARSFEEALQALEDYFGTSDHTRWAYGELHYYKPEHPAFPSMNLPEAPAGGATWSVNVAPIKSFSPDEGMPVTAGPSIRMIADLSSTIFWIQLPGGESGSPYSNHYHDIYTCCWLTGVYIEYRLDRSPSFYGEPALIFEGSQ